MVRPTEKHVLLASNSPRRRELLKMIVPEFGIAVKRDIDESFPADMRAEDIPAYLSRIKAEAYRDQLAPGEVILTADTIVINNGLVMGKPHGEDDAVEMLVSLKGHSHKVVTGVSLTTVDGMDTFSEETKVTFGEVSRSEILDYVRNFQPYDKAGAYGIQEWIGCVGIEGIEGCFYNVMGLPLHRLYQHLRKI